MHLIKSILFFLLCSLSVFANTPPLATKITDLAGKSVTYNYNTDDDLSSVTDQMGSSENSFLFTGEQLDKESENYYLRARYYSPTSSRFLTRDTYDGTAGNPITQNHYLYGNANPMMYVDPSGRMSMMSLTSSIGIMGALASMRTIGSSAIVRGAITTTARTLARSIAKGAKGGIGKTISTTQMYYILTIARLYSRLGDDTSNDMIPIQVYGSNNLPEHQDHIFDSMVGMGSNGRPTAGVLTRVGNEINNRNFLAKECQGYPRPRSSNGGKQHCDEYPYNSTLQGGTENFNLGNISVRLVPADESNKQGGFIRSFYSKAPVDMSDNFLVIPLGGTSGYFDKNWRWHEYR